MNADAAYRNLIAALCGLAAGKGLTEIVRVPPYGTQTRIAEALQAARSLEGDFSADHFDYVDEAFYKFGAKRTNDSIRICTESFLDLASRREPRDPFESPIQHRQTLSGRIIRSIDGKAFKYEARYTREYPRTYDAKIWFGGDDLRMPERDHFKGPLLDMELSEGMQRDLVRHAVESKIQNFEA